VQYVVADFFSLMPILKDIAQVLRVHEQGNTSLVAVLLGQKLGQFRVHAKGARRWPKKGFEGGMDLLSRGEILVYPRSGETLWVFREWDERARPALGGSLLQLRAASYLCELSEALTRHTSGAAQDDEDSSGESTGARLYDILALSADALASDAHPGAVLLSFTLRALHAEGLLPELDCCMFCEETPAPGAVWLTAEGICCTSCYRKEQIAARTVSAPPLKGAHLASAERPRGLGLSAEAYRALIYVHETARPVKLSPPAAEQLARAMILLVHAALEHDLRTLLNAARMVRLMGAKETGRPQRSAR
jgi:recombinational DNA repair protein (RecF pathway)